MRYLTVSGPVRRVLSVYLLPYLLVLLSISVALHPLWLRQFPRLNLYRGDLFFSGERAHEQLRLLANRSTDQPAASEDWSSADWMADAFSGLGLETSVESFQAFVPAAGVNSDLFIAPMQQTHRVVRGTNVVALSPGVSPVTVLLLAHRDVNGSDPLGLGKNAGGNAALLELARILTTGDHFYTYLFVSTDATELGMEGAQYLIRSRPDLSLRVAVSLDGLSSAGANTIALYNFGTNRRAAPLWTVALAHDVLAAQGLTSAGLSAIDAPGVAPQSGPLALLASLINQRGLGLRSTAEGEAFLNRGDATLGVSLVALNTGAALAAAPASLGSQPVGSIDQINPDALRLAGQFIEQYVRSLDLNQFDSVMLSRLYVVFEGQYLPAENVNAFGAMIQTAFVVLALLPFFEPPVEGRKFANFFEREMPWLAKIAAVALLAGLIWQLPRIELFRIFPAGIYMLFTVGIVLVGGAILVRRRLQYLMLWRFASTVAHQRRVLVMLLLMIYMGFTTLFSPFTAAAMLFVPFLVWAAVRFTQPLARRVWLGIFAAWTVLHAAMSVMVLYAIISRTPPWSAPALGTWVLCAVLWLVVLVYVFSTPPLGVVERK